MMTREERDKILDKLAEYATENMDMYDLLQFFYCNQYDYYDSLSDKELLQELEDNIELKEQYEKLLTNEKKI